MEITLKDQLTEIVDKHKRAVEKSFTAAQLEVCERIARELLKAFQNGNKLLLCGNGGSAADAQHIAAEFIARFKKERKSLPAIALTTDTSILTAVSNDYDFNQVFVRQIEGLGQKGDVLIAISTSGRSENVLQAIRQAKTQDILTVGFTGGTGGALKDMVDICFLALADETSHIQEVHTLALHAISEIVEEVFFGS